MESILLLLPTDDSGVISDNDVVRCFCPVPAQFAFDHSPVASDVLYRSTVHNFYKSEITIVY